jgi:hypothetical protein
MSIRESIAARPANAFEAGPDPHYYVRPTTLYVVENNSEHIYITGLRWSEWAGGYGVHGLIGGAARGTGILHFTGAGTPSIVTIHLWDVTNGGTNAFTYYRQMSIRSDRAVPDRWYWNRAAAKWET